MASILRITLSRSSYCGQCVGGIFQAPCGSQNSFSVLSNLRDQFPLNALIQCRAIKTFPKLSAKQPNIAKHHNISRKLKELNMRSLSSIDVPDGVLINGVQKLFELFFKFKHSPSAMKYLSRYTSSPDFERFYANILNTMKRLSSMALINLIDFQHLSAVGNSEINNTLEKVFESLLTRFDELSLLEKVFLYGKLRRNPKPINTDRRKKLIQKCEEYFRNDFQRELQFYNLPLYPEELSYFTGDLPDSVREIVARKAVFEALDSLCTHTKLATTIRFLCESHYDLLDKNDFLKLFRKATIKLNSPRLCKQLCTSYRVLITKDDSYYDEEIINALVSQSYRKIHEKLPKVFFTYDLCLMGYYDRNVLGVSCDYILSTRFNKNNVFKRESFIVLDILVRYSFNSIVRADDVATINSLFETYKFLDSSFNFGCIVCENLTYMGGNTRQLCEELFELQLQRRKGVEEDNSFEPEVEAGYNIEAGEKNVLTLYHLAKTNPFCQGLEVDEEELEHFLRAEFAQLKNFSVEDLGPYLGRKNHVLRNCTTSDKHGLHFVSLFGPDKNAINLAKYETDMILRNTFLNIEEIEKQPGCKIIAFQVYRDKQPIYYVNKPIMSGKAKMYLKVFENVDCSIVLLPPKFFRLTDAEKDDFIKARINEIFENSQNQETKAVEQ